MAWAAVGAAITPNNQWQFTAPVEGEFFRLKHTRSPNEPKAWICQAEKLEDDSYQIFDVQPIHANNVNESFRLQKPAIFTNRCIGFRYAVDYRSPWIISIEASDIYSASTVLTNVSKKTLTYASNGDSNGICYWIGTEYGTQNWVNPHVAQKVIVSATGTRDVNSNDISILVDRQSSSATGFYWVTGAGASIILDLGQKNRLIPNYYSWRHWQHPDRLPRNWLVRGTNDLTSFDNLRIHENDSTATSSNGWISFPINNIIKEYRFMQIIENGNNSNGVREIVASEIEFYGELIKS